MTIFGVAGSVALLFTGLGIRSSISGIADRQFGQLLRYDLLVVKNSQASQKAQKELKAKLASNDVERKLPVAFYQLQEKVQGSDEAQAVSLIVSQDKQLGGLVKLDERTSGKQLQLTKNGAVVSEKLASLAQVKRATRCGSRSMDKQQKSRSRLSVKCTLAMQSTCRLIIMKKQLGRSIRAMPAWWI